MVGGAVSRDQHFLHVAGLRHSRPEALYFWFYFVFMNAIWIILPGLIIVASAGCANRAVGSRDRWARSLQVLVSAGAQQMRHPSLRGAMGLCARRAADAQTKLKEI